LVQAASVMDEIDAIRAPQHPHDAHAKTTPDVRFNAVDPGQTAAEFTGGVGHVVDAISGKSAADRVAAIPQKAPEVADAAPVAGVVTIELEPGCHASTVSG
jgi:hypothetical protein